MITQIKDIPNTMVGFRVAGKVTRDEFDHVVLPAVAELIQRTDQLNYILVLDTAVRNFTVDVWIKEALLTLNNLTQWNRVAIVSDAESLHTITNLFNNTEPRECRGFPPEQLNEAIEWVSGTEKKIFQPEDDMRE